MGRKDAMEIYEYKGVPINRNEHEKVCCHEKHLSFTKKIISSFGGVCMPAKQKKADNLCCKIAANAHPPVLKTNDYNSINNRQSITLFLIVIFLLLEIIGF